MKTAIPNLKIGLQKEFQMALAQIHKEPLDKKIVSTSCVITKF